jgi:hypothetical protein
LFSNLPWSSSWVSSFIFIPKPFFGIVMGAKCKLHGEEGFSLLGLHSPHIRSQHGDPPSGLFQRPLQPLVISNNPKRREVYMFPSNKGHMQAKRHNPPTLPHTPYCQLPWQYELSKCDVKVAVKPQEWTILVGLNCSIVPSYVQFSVVQKLTWSSECCGSWVIKV